MVLFYGESHASLQNLPALSSLEYSNPVLMAQRNETAQNLRRAAQQQMPKVGFRRYTLKKGEDFFIVMARTMLDHDTLSTINELETLWSLSPGDTWIIPNMRGIALKGGREEIAQQYHISLEWVVAVPGKDDMFFLPAQRLKQEERNFVNLTAFIRPVSGRVTSHFGSRSDPFTQKARFHKGIDIGCPIGSKVVASASGTVSFVGWKSGYGKTVVIDHGNGYKTLYGHLSGYKVQKGKKVKQGDAIALSGNTGRSTGPHLHFEVRKEGNPQRPVFTQSHQAQKI